MALCETSSIRPTKPTEFFVSAKLRRKYLLEKIKLSNNNEVCLMNDYRLNVKPPEMTLRFIHFCQPTSQPASVCIQKAIKISFYVTGSKYMKSALFRVKPVVTNH